MLEKAFEQGTEPVGVIYDLKFTGMRPARTSRLRRFGARIHRLAGASSASLFRPRRIDAAFEKLCRTGLRRKNDG
ncbi:hypothetical protein [Cohnella faecalis]|uniref:Uncharacterized protein n=1 Tax=Cohnella faecalis TaxID=2315694 RepID=A0A398CUG5_9BACL|nr:hypothetical protein [Cohnella faecalis]RIE03497.1 hypothetical protein D3H35_12680 [Cohnella faecalis]